MPGYNPLIAGFNAGAQAGWAGLQQDERQKQLKQQQGMQLMKSLQDLLVLPPGPMKDLAVQLTSQQWEGFGTPLPKEMWGLLKKADEEQIAMFQGMSGDLASLGVT